MAKKTEAKVATMTQNWVLRAVVASLLKNSAAERGRM